MSEPDGTCKDCLYKQRMEREILKLQELQQEYEDKISKVNKTLFKYTQKVDELDAQLAQKDKK